MKTRAKYIDRKSWGGNMSERTTGYWGRRAPLYLIRDLN